MTEKRSATPRWPAREPVGTRWLGAAVSGPLARAKPLHRGTDTPFSCPSPAPVGEGKRHGGCARLRNRRDARVRVQAYGLSSLTPSTPLALGSGRRGPPSPRSSPPVGERNQEKGMRDACPCRHAMAWRARGLPRAPSTGLRTGLSRGIPGSAAAADAKPRHSLRGSCTRESPAKRAGSGRLCYCNMQLAINAGRAAHAVTAQAPAPAGASLDAVGQRRFA